jgi:hypothetical protein
MNDQPETITITLAAQEGVDLEDAYYQLQYALHQIGLEELEYERP